MAIHWFPGHMATARREIRAAMPEVDLVLEVLDARIPWSSENPLVPALRGAKPHIRILNKSDLADPATTAAWVAYFSAQTGAAAVAHHHQAPGLARQLLQLARSLVPEAKTAARPLLAMVLGIPNVGKSTLLNTLSGRTIAKTSDKPGVTKLIQRINAGGLVLLDTPGFLWPKLDPPVCGTRLALTGAIPPHIWDAPEVAEAAAVWLSANMSGPVIAHYGLPTLPTGPGALVDAIGRRRGALMKGGVIDRQKASERLLHDLRAGAFGPYSLEHPDDIAKVPDPETADPA